MICQFLRRMCSFELTVPLEAFMVLFLQSASKNRGKVGGVTQKLRGKKKKNHLSTSQHSWSNGFFPDFTDWGSHGIYTPDGHKPDCGIIEALTTPMMKCRLSRPHANASLKLTLWGKTFKLPARRRAFLLIEFTQELRRGPSQERGPE